MKKEKPVGKTRAFPIEYGCSRHFCMMRGFGMSAKWLILKLFYFCKGDFCHDNP